MKYKEFKVSLSEQSAPNTVSIMVYFDDNTTKVIDDIPLSVFNSPEFRTVLQGKITRKYNKIVVRYARVGNTTSQGNPDGNTLDTTIPTTLTSPNGEEEIEQTPDQVERPQTTTGSQVISSTEFAKRMNAYADRVDKDRDNKHDETGEPVSRLNDQGKYVDAYGNILDDPRNDIDLPKFDPSEFGGGEDGEAGITAEEEAEVPSIVEQLFASIDGFGTNETKMIAALSKITSPAQLNEIIKAYRKEYDRGLPVDIIGEFEFQGGNTNSVIAELNDVMMPLGWKLTGTPFTSLQWKRYEGQGE
jgi:hypothetical protein